PGPWRPEPRGPSSPPTSPASGRPGSGRGASAPAGSASELTWYLPRAALPMGFAGGRQERPWGTARADRTPNSPAPGQVSCGEVGLLDALTWRVDSQVPGAETCCTPGRLPSARLALVTVHSVLPSFHTTPVGTQMRADSVRPGASYTCLPGRRRPAG